MTDDIFNRVRDIVATQLKIDSTEVIESARFREDLGADSYDSAEILIAFEDEFNIKIGNREVANLHSVDDFVKLIREKTG